MKLSLVVAALMDADILLLDEPTNHLDKKYRMVRSVPDDDAGVLHDCES